MTHYAQPYSYCYYGDDADENDGDDVFLANSTAPIERSVNAIKHIKIKTEAPSL